MSNENELSYREVISRNGDLQKQLRREKMIIKLLKKENAVQLRVIGQLKTLLNAHQTKPTCLFRHRWCNIDHSKYNLVKSVCQPNQHQRSSIKADNPKDTMCPLALAKKVDKLQRKYGIPSHSSRENTSEDLICPEFASIWKNVLCFGFKILEVDPIKTKTISNNQLHFKPSKNKYTFSSIILESRPYKFKSAVLKTKQTGFRKTILPEPMSDADLAKALNIDQFELEEAFGYSKSDLNKICNDDVYEMDTCGLELLNESELSTANFGQEAAVDLDDKELAAAFGYVDTCSGDDAMHEHMNEDTSDNENIAAECGHGKSADDTADSGDIAAQFGYGTGADNTTDSGDIAAEFGYGTDDDNMATGASNDEYDATEGEETTEDEGSSYEDDASFSSGDGETHTSSESSSSDTSQDDDLYSSS